LPPEQESAEFRKTLAVIAARVKKTNQRCSSASVTFVLT
jgi:hypothetical protein